MNVNKENIEIDVSSADTNASMNANKENIEIDVSSVDTNVAQHNKNEGQNVNVELKEWITKTTESVDNGNINSIAKLNGAWGKSSNFVTEKLDNKLLIIPTETNANGEEGVVFDVEIIEDGSNKWNLTVCGQFVGCSWNLNEARYHIRRMWNKFGLKDITVNESGIFFFNCMIWRYRWRNQQWTMDG